jgi:hypothetical protein
MTIHSNIACANCNYNLTGIDLAGLCPECGTKIINNCFKCDYNLEGLDPSELCPECGLPIEHSIGRGAIALADDDYLKKLHKGVFFIQTAIIFMVLQAMFGGIIGATAAMGTGTNQLDLFIQIGLQVVSLAVSLLYLIGWFKFSTACPLQGMFYTGSTTRKLVRFTVIASLIIVVLQLVSNIMFTISPNSGLFIMLIGIASIAWFVIFVIRFFAELFYVRWMAPLLMNKRVHKRTTTLLWMGPILFVSAIISGFMAIFISLMAGLLMLIIALSALVMLVMYWNMLDWIRKDLKAIRQSSLEST